MHSLSAILHKLKDSNNGKIIFDEEKRIQLSYQDLENTLRNVK